MINVLIQYLPEKAVTPCFELVKLTETHLRVVNSRQSKHGDFRIMPDGSYRITINSNLNKYRFLITLIHEIAHLIAHKKYGLGIKPHGIEWKKTFSQLIAPFLNLEIFPEELLPIIHKHFDNPKASSGSDPKLSVALRCYDETNHKTLLDKIPMGGLFRLHNGRIFTKGVKKVKRYICKEVESGKEYFFNPVAEVEWLEKN